MDKELLILSIDHGTEEDKQCAILNLVYDGKDHIIYQTFDKEQIAALNKIFSEALVKYKNTESTKALKCLEDVAKAPSFMGGNAKYLYHTKSEIPFMEDIDTIKQALMQYDSLQEYLDVDDNTSWTFKNKSGIEVTVVTKKYYDELEKALLQKKKAFNND